MQKIETTATHFMSDIKEFYDASLWHFITINCLDTGEGFEVQYFFAKYDCVDEVVCYYFYSPYEAPIPSIASLIPSAYLGEGEMVDMFGIQIEGIEKGMFLDEDSLQTPLRRGS
jgi:NADH:ubiquinone oxidoreductase subunit C